MRFEKPWESEYSSLLNELVSRFGGKVIETTEKGEKEGRAWSDKSRFLYPKFESELDGKKFSIDINERCHFRVQAYEGLGYVTDNVEYLRIGIEVPSPYKVIIQRERFTDKLLKALSLEWEFQTGNKDFDKSFFLAVKTEQDKKMICDAKIQQLIIALAPFEELAIHSSGVYWSQEISSPSQITVAHVLKYLDKAIELAKAIKTSFQKFHLPS